jgi:hypothetical protein
MRTTRTALRAIRRFPSSAVFGGRQSGMCGCCLVVQPLTLILTPAPEKSSRGAGDLFRFSTTPITKAAKTAA